MLLCVCVQHLQVCLGVPVASVIMFGYPVVHETFMKAVSKRSHVGLNEYAAFTRVLTCSGATLSTRAPTKRTRMPAARRYRMSSSSVTSRLVNS